MVAERDRLRLARALVPLGAFAVYAWLCPPVSGMGDASELTLVLATLGVPHPTGYPLYVVSGHAFGALLHAAGIGWPLAAALWSAAGAAVAVGILFALGLRLAAAAAPAAGVPTRLLAALVPLALFAFQPIAVAEATRTEVNSWSLAWVCAAAHAFVRLIEAIDAGAVRPPPAAPRTAALWGFVCGVGLAHHLTSILVSAPLSAALLVGLLRGRRPVAAPVAAAAGAALLPLASYAFIAWRAWHPAPAQWALLEPSLASVVAHVTGTQYRHFLGYFAPTPFQGELLAGVAYPFLGAGSILLVAGLWRAGGTAWRIAWSGLLASALLTAGFTFLYGVQDPAPYFLPAMALGTAAAAPALASAVGAAPRGGAAALGAVGLVALVVIVPWIRDGVAVREATLEYEHAIRSMWSAIPPDTAIVSWADDRFHRLREYQLLRGEKPALLVVTPDLFFAASVRREIRERFGADPLEGFRPPRVVPGAKDEREVIERHRLELVQSLNARVRVPVILFDPSRPIVFQLRKPWEPPEGAAGGASGAERRSQGRR
jgi:transmembrane protein TMEM260 (protein O-mannosyltransferase)